MNFSFDRPAYLVCILYILTWVAPLVLASILALFGFNFSYVGREWQSQNIFLIMWLIILAILTGLIGGLISLKFFSRYLINLINQNKLSTESLKPISMIFPIFVLGISGIGLFKSFLGTFFEVIYSGASQVWLGVGAWSIMFLVSLGLIFGNFFNKYRTNIILIFLSTLFFIPTLMCGSRIDFISFMIAVQISIFFLEKQKLLHKIILSFSVFLFSFLICSYIGQLRFTNGNFSELIALPTPTIIISEENRMYYLSTLGDISASVYQLVGLIESHHISFVGLAELLERYALRLVPGFIWNNRPGDISYEFAGNLIGGGATHALGEGYLASGQLGVFVISVFIGFLGALSGIFAEQYKKFPSAYNWLFFAFPWLLVVRGGWYQFFSFFKSLEFLFLFLLAMWGIKIFSRKLRLST